MRILIAGGGKIGSTLISQLSAEGHEITVIDRNTEVLEKIMEHYDVIAVAGNSASMGTLEEAGIMNADLMIAATDTDEVNLLSCMTAHGLNPDLHTIGRIRNPEYRRQAYEMRDVFALNMVVNPEREAAQEIARLLKFPGFLKIDTFAKGNIEIVELRIDAGSPLKDASMRNLSSIIHGHALICAVVRDGECVIPDGSFILREGDMIFATASANNLSALLKTLGIITRKAKRVLIAGGGRITYYLVRELEKSGMDCTVIESRNDRCHWLAEQLPNATVIEGDASSQDFLDSVGLGDSDALVTMTGLDELNIVISLYANTRNVSQIVTKISHAENNKILDSMSIGSVISPKELASNLIVRYVRAMQDKQGAAVAMHTIANGRAEAMEFIVEKDTKHIGEKLRTFRIKKNVLIAAIAHAGYTDIASGNASFEEGDSIVVVTNRNDAIRTLNDIFEE